MGSNKRIVKRLVARENEFVSKGDGSFLYVPPGHCWVEGDNAELSVDSRSFGPVPMGLLDALAISVVWPFWRSRYFDELSEWIEHLRGIGADFQGVRWPQTSS